MSDQRKVWMLEVLAALTIAASLSAVAVPKYAEITRRDTASQLLGDIDVVRSAVYRFYSDSAYFPEESPIGSIPDNLVAYLPEHFSFGRSYGTIEYKNWPVRPPQEGDATSQVIGVTVTASDPRIGATAAMLAPSTAQFTVGNRFTFVFFGS